jgi:thioesterase domain-containing protein
MSDWKAASFREKGVSNFLSNRNLSRRILLSLGLRGPGAKLETRDSFPAECYDQRLQHYIDATARRYDPVPYGGKILLIRCKQQPKPVFLDLSLGWAPYAAGGIKVVSVPGTHFTMFGDPGVERMAAAISAALVEVETSAALTEDCS